MATEYLTMAEIEQKYQHEWVLLDRPKHNKSDELLGGHVIVHSSDRADFERLALAAPIASRRIASLYIGEPAPDEVWML